MTKIHEEVFRGSISEAIAHFSNPKGEFTLVIAGSEGGQAPDSDEAALALASRLRAEGVRAQEARRRGCRGDGALQAEGLPHLARLGDALMRHPKYE